ALRSLDFARDFGSRLGRRENALNFVGDLTAGVPPVPIPNTAVKPRRADGTARESVWERRSSPALKIQRPVSAMRLAFLFFRNRLDDEGREQKESSARLWVL